ncbi:MAG: sigma-54-dependent Fis family transcriptional regulator [Myxococcales bacterium]|nr:sigma-54-dependent Fis family transcriptional regulator [Myxococcales bacterium]
MTKGSSVTPESRSAPGRAGAPATILVVEDDEDTRLALCDTLADLGHVPLPRPDGAAALRELDDAEFDLVLTDMKMPGIDGIQLCRQLVGDRPSVPVVVMTAFGDVDAAVGALRAGAFDFITKPVSLAQLDAAVTKALERERASPVVLRLEPLEPVEATTHGLLGPSSLMAKVRDQLTRVAATNSTVLVTGESGTGKEIASRAIHQGSDRRDGPFVAVSCAAVPHDILESELFGHAKGAFTGASEARVGLFQRAHGGTLFLDEIGDMPLDLQPKLLRALEERLIRPVGSAQEVECDVRIVAATNKNLQHAARLGHFREDLYFRIKVLHIHMPPLRERGAEDVLALSRHFLESFSGVPYVLAPEAERLLVSYHWPGNVRELENTLNAAMALAEGGRIGFEELPTSVRSPRKAGRPELLDVTSLEEVERRHIQVVLRAVGGNKVQAARRLGIDRATLYRKLERLGLERERR